MTATLGLAMAMAVSCGGTAVAAPQQSAGRASIGVELSPGRGIVVLQNEYWYIRGTFSFTVTATDIGRRDDENLFVFVSMPDELRVIDVEGSRWSCDAVDGGVDCTNPDLVIPGEAWPELTLTAISTGWVYDSIDAYAIADSGKWAHDGVPFAFETST